MADILRDATITGAPGEDAGATPPEPEAAAFPRSAADEEGEEAERGRTDSVSDEQFACPV